MAQWGCMGDYIIGRLELQSILQQILHRLAIAGPGWSQAYKQNSNSMNGNNNDEEMDDYDNGNRERKKNEMVSETHRRNKETGVFETINDIFTRLPLPRLEKNSYRFLFENIKESVENLLEQENQVQEIQKVENDSIDAIEVKLSKPATVPPEEIQDQMYKQKLASTHSLSKSLVYMRNQKPEFGLTKEEGNMEPFLLDSHYINFEKIKKEIPNVKLFLQDSISLKRHAFEFVNENEIIFKDKSFPSSVEINKRAEILAKLYLLDLYREEGRKLMLLDRNEEAEMEKIRGINKIKQGMEMEKMKEGEFIEDMDILKQVYKIVEWIEKKMNALAFEEFKSKNGDRATQIKKSLEKLKATVNEQIFPVKKLKILISYKYKKGW